MNEPPETVLAAAAVETGISNSLNVVLTNFSAAIACSCT
jgi:hypothetical protein